MAKRKLMGRRVELADQQEDLFAPSVVSPEMPSAAPFSETERTKKTTQSKKKGEPERVEATQTAPPGVWLRATALEQRPIHNYEIYPCRCDDDVTDDEFARLPQTRRDAYRKEGIRPKRCAPWRARGVPEDAPGAWRSKCPCWGRQRDVRLPDGCCAFMDVNPAYPAKRWSALDGALSVVSSTGGTEATLADPGDGLDGRGDGEPQDGPSGPLYATESAETPDFRPGGSKGGLKVAQAIVSDPDARFFDGLGLPIEVESRPVRADWSSASVQCDCRTPWDGKKKTGYHAMCCHRNFKSLSVAELHQRSWIEPCRDPAIIADVDTGRPLMRLSVDTESGLSVWGIAYVIEEV